VPTIFLLDISTVWLTCIHNIDGIFVNCDAKKLTSTKLSFNSEDI